MEPTNHITMLSIIETDNLNIVYEFPISLFSKCLIFKLPFKKKITCLINYRYNVTFSFLLLTIKIWIISIDLEFLELVRNLQWLLEIITYAKKNRKHINESLHI